MRLIIAGCEYAGTTTLAEGVQRWVEENLGDSMLIHDHWKLPHVSGHPPTETKTVLTEAEVQQVLALTPKVKELLTRYTLYYHTAYAPDGETSAGTIVVGYYLDEMVYGPFYFGYGGPGEPGDRGLEAQVIEQRIARLTPETVLVLVKASPEVISRRMAATPHEHGLLRAQDVELVLRRFEEAFARSSISRKLVLDTSQSTPERTLREFLDKMGPYWTEADRLRVLTRTL